MRQRNFNYSKYLHLKMMDQETKDFLHKIRNMDRIQSVAWHLIEGVEPVLNQTLIRVEDVSGEVYEFTVKDVFMDTEEKQQRNLREISTYIYNILMTQHKLGLIDESPFLIDIYLNMNQTVNRLREMFPYTGQHDFNLYYDGSLINPFRDPEHIF